MFDDPAVNRNRAERLHGWVPWVAGFSAHFVQSVLAKEDGTPGKTVLDPFAGVGTTLVEAKKVGHHAVGFEINPYPALACEAKLCWDLSAEQRRQAVARFVNELRVMEAAIDAHHGQRQLTLDVHSASGQQLVSLTYGEVVARMAEPPPNFRSRIPFFPEAIHDKVLAIKSLITEIPDANLQRMFLVALGTILVEISNYSYEPSLGTRKAAGKPTFENLCIHQIFANKLKTMNDDLDWVRHEYPDAGTHRVITASSTTQLPDRLDSDSVDLAITSPPYLNNLHYIRNSRPHLYWLDLVKDTGQVNDLETQYFGQFWQTVRGLKAVPLKFEDADVEATVHQFKAINKDAKYPGRTWGNYAAQYFNDTYEHLAGMFQVLRPGAAYYSVIGNSIIQGVPVHTEQLVAGIAAKLGFKVDGIHDLRTRVGNSIVGTGLRKIAMNGAKVALKDWVVVMRKPA